MRLPFFVAAERQGVLADVYDNVRDYAGVIRFVVLRLDGKITTPTCPHLESMRLQGERPIGVTRCWQDGRKYLMPNRDLNSNRWGIVPKTKGRQAI